MQRLRQRPNSPADRFADGIFHRKNHPPLHLCVRLDSHPPQRGEMSAHSADTNLDARAEKAALAGSGVAKSESMSTSDWLARRHWIRTEGTPFRLDGVIPGWTEGVQMMVEGEKRRFWIPAKLAYDGQPGSPQGMLVFDVELIRILS